MAFGFNENPAPGPIPTGGLWQALSWSIIPVYPIGTYVQYLGITYVNLTTASTAGTPPPGGVWTVTTQNQDPWQSAFAASGFYPQITPALFALDIPDCAFQSPDIQVLPLTVGVYTMAPGRGLMTCSGAGFLQFFIGAVGAGAWVTVHTFAATGAIYAYADGVNVRWANTTGAALTFTFYRERQPTQ
jgi:hypothetical protein